MTLNESLPTVHGAMGRPAYSDKVRAAILANLRIGCTRTAAFGAAGISEATFFRWMRDDEEFRQAVADAEAKAEQVYTGRLARKAASGDERAIEFWLSRRRPANWREKISVDDKGLTLEDELDEALEHDAVATRLQAIADEAIRRRASGAGSGASEGTQPEASVIEPS